MTLTAWLDLLAQVEFEGAMRDLNGEHLLDVTFIEYVDGERIETDAQYLETGS